jgi:hypothetical protein
MPWPHVISAPRGIWLDEGTPLKAPPTIIRAQVPKQTGRYDASECLSAHRTELVTPITWNRACSVPRRNSRPRAGITSKRGSRSTEAVDAYGENFSPVVTRSRQADQSRNRCGANGRWINCGGALDADQRTFGEDCLRAVGFDRHSPLGGAP